MLNHLRHLEEMKLNLVFSLTILIFISVSTAYENLAYLKPTWQSHELIRFDSRVSAENVANGYKTDLTRWSSHCAISQNNVRAATLWVNLKSICSIHHIKIYYRTDNLKWGPSNGYTARFLGFYLYVSNTTNRNDGYLCYHDTKYTRATIPAVVNIVCPVYGQYVIYYNERLEGVKYPSDYSTYAYTEICELEIYGCYERYSRGKCPEYCGDCPLYKECPEGDITCKKVCPVGFFGKNCQQNCSSHCFYSNRCDTKSGTCQEGCKPGWKGLLCDKECGSGEYGRNCSTHCGHCRDDNNCDPIDGSCPAGCAGGYTGETCSMKCNVGFYGLDCKQECSTYCNVSGVCDHVSGSCKDGCKSGWQGMDCLELKIKDGGKRECVNTSGDCACSLTIYVSISLVCVGVLVICPLFLYIIHLRTSRWPLVNKCGVRFDKDLSARSTNTKEKTYDTIGFNASQSDEKSTTAT